MKGIATLGALVELQKAHWLGACHRFAGTSVGAILAALLATDTNLEQVFRDHILNFKYCPSYDLGSLDKHFGLDTGVGLEKWIDALLGEPTTFAEIQAKYNNTLLICASNLNTRQPVIFGPDTHPDMDVALALRLSCSIPLYFTAKTYDKELYVDGAVTENFPIAAASAQGTYTVLGIRLKSTAKPQSFKWTLESFLGALVECSVMDPAATQPPHTLVLDVDAGPGTSPINFRMSPEAMKRMYDTGKTQARAFIHLVSKKNV